MVTNPGEDVGVMVWLVEHLWVPLITGAWFVGRSAFGVLDHRINEVKKLASEAVSEKRFEDLLKEQREYRQHRETVDERLFDALDDLRNLVIQKLR